MRGEIVTSHYSFFVKLATKEYYERVLEDKSLIFVSRDINRIAILLESIYMYETCMNKKKKKAEQKVQ